MTSLTKRKRFSAGDLDDKMMEQDKCNHYVDSIHNDVAPDLNTISEGSGSSGSSIAVMNNNTNGKVISMTSAHVNTNDNRQLLAEAPTVQIPANASTVMKKIKQIYMDEVPLHLSGLSISGSGMELFVKLDEKLDTALRQANSSSPIAKRGKKRKRMTKVKKFKNFVRVIGVPDTHSNKAQDMEAFQSRLDKGYHKKSNGDHAGDVSGGGMKTKDSEDDEEISEITGKKEHEVVDTHSKPSVTERMRQIQMTPQTIQPYRNYEWNQTPFQQPPPPTPTLQNNVIRGPVWNVDNGKIDVIRSRDVLPSTSKVQYNNTTKENSEFDGPLDYSVNPFPCGFNSQNLPLKRRMSPPRWGVYNVGQDNIQETQVYHDDFYGDINISASTDFTSKDRLRKVRDGNVRKVSTKKNRRMAGPSTSQEEDITAIENNFLANDRDCVKKTVSDVSNNQQSSVGPQFQTELLTPQIMDAETLLKFTEYTHDLRKDLKQKYKDLSKLLKAFEETVQYKNTSQEEAEEQEEPQVGRCNIM